MTTLKKLPCALFYFFLKKNQELDQRAKRLLKTLYS